MEWTGVEGGREGIKSAGVKIGGSDEMGAQIVGERFVLSFPVKKSRVQGLDDPGV